MITQEQKEVLLAVYLAIRNSSKTEMVGFWNPKHRTVINANEFERQIWNYITGKSKLVSDGDQVFPPASKSVCHCEDCKWR